LNPRFLAVVVLCAAGCAGRAPVVVSPESGSPTALRIAGKGRVDIGRDRFRFETALALRSPDRLHVEISGPVGGTRAVLAMRGDQVIVLLPSDRIVIEGEPTAAMFESLLGLRLDGRALVRLLDSLGDEALPGTRIESGLKVTRQADLLVAEADPATADGFRRLELRVREVERVPAGDLPETLFAPAVPTGWRRIDPAGIPPGSPLLLP
jgi:hypothetical protein